MAMAITLQEYLDREGIPYELVQHPHTSTSMETAAEARVPGDQLAKGVMLEDENGYVMAVIPATHRLELGSLHKQLNRRLGLATEQELAELFDDCEIGAVPPVGTAYGYDVVIDDSLTECPDVYLEAGDHTDLVHLSGQAFRELVAGATHGRFSRHV